MFSGDEGTKMRTLLLEKGSFSNEIGHGQTTFLKAIQLSNASN